jgi:tellurite methyltransferase
MKTYLWVIKARNHEDREACDSNWLNGQRPPSASQTIARGTMHEVQEAPRPCDVSIAVTMGRIAGGWGEEPRGGSFPHCNLGRTSGRGVLSAARKSLATPNWAGYYRWTSGRPPRELLLRALDHIDWEGKDRRKRTAIDLGFGAGTDTLELLRRGWWVLGIDREPAALDFLSRRVPLRQRRLLTLQTSPMEGLSLPKVNLIYASFSLPFCTPEEFPRLWATIRRSLVPGGHFAGQLFGDRDAWAGKRPMTFLSKRQVQTLARGYRVELFRETEEEGQSFEGPKHWHFFDLILEKPRAQ